MYRKSTKIEFFSIQLTIFAIIINRYLEKKHKNSGTFKKKKRNKKMYGKAPYRIFIFLINDVNSN